MSNAQPRVMGALREMRDVRHAVVLAYREDVTPLVEALEKEGFEVEVQRATYTEDELRYSSNSRTFLNHRNAWEKVSQRPGWTLICEGDFVPCVGMGAFPVFWPSGDDLAWGYLYQGSPRILAIEGPEGWLRGHCAPLVAYVVSARVAGLMLRYFEEETKRRSLTDYFSFDAHLQWVVMGLGAKAYISRRHYGEHGGLPNPEHAVLPRAGRHRADVLRGPLHFLPPYALGSEWRFHVVRGRNRVMGYLRIAAGRWLLPTNVHEWSLRARLRMLLAGLKRLTY